MRNNSGEDYDSRRAHYRRMLTVYGRKAVLEALTDPALDCRTLHLAGSNRESRIIADIRQRARERGAALREHSRESLSRISRNGRQDQGVALDVLCPQMRELDVFLREADHSAARLLAFDALSNPQNMGMALRSACAAGVTGVLYADRGNPDLGPLVIKASAGVVFRAPLLRCSTIAVGAARCLEAGFKLYRLRADAPLDLFQTPIAAPSLFVLGGESEGLSDALLALPGLDLHIPMAAGVESLNVAVAAALVAFATGGHFDR